METAKGYIIQLENEPQPYEDWSYLHKSFLNLGAAKDYIVQFKVKSMEHFNNEVEALISDSYYKDYSTEEIEEMAHRYYVDYMIDIIDVSTLKKLITINNEDTLEKIKGQLDGI